MSRLTHLDTRGDEAGRLVGAMSNTASHDESFQVRASHPPAGRPEVETCELGHSKPLANRFRIFLETPSGIFYCEELCVVESHFAAHLQ